MLQIDHVYEFLYQELFKNFEFWHLIGGVPKTENISISDISVFKPASTNNKIFFYDQEPLYKETPPPQLKSTDVLGSSPVRIIIIANSERSEFKREFLKSGAQCYDWYYFFHGFAALDWYRDFKYFSLVDYPITKLFISYKHRQLHLQTRNDKRHFRDKF